MEPLAPWAIVRLSALAVIVVQRSAVIGTVFRAIAPVLFRATSLLVLGENDLVGKQISVDQRVAHSGPNFPAVRFNIIDLLQGLWNVLVSENLVVDLVISQSLVVVTDSLPDFVEVFDGLVHLFLLHRSLGCDDEVEDGSIGEGVDALAAEEVADILDVHAQEFEGSGVVVLHALRHVDDVKSLVVVEDVVLAQIGMHQPTDLV